MAKPSKPRVPKLPELLGLWRGGDGCPGYMHEGLAREICKQLKPNSFEVLAGNLYPGVPLTDIPADGLEMAKRAYEWCNEEKERAYKRGLIRRRVAS